MTDSHSGNAALQWANTFFRSLLQYGVEHVIISPGSRSTPLTLAAAVNDRLQKHVILDERSAAFTALGIGKSTNLPAVLICTSGTALANYHPAVIEARQSGIPMILATADRPPNLRATGANQAIDQLKIFGDYPVFFHEVDEPKREDTDRRRLEILAQQAFSLSREKRGPVHLNFAFRKPLEPGAGYLKQLKKENDESSIPKREVGQLSSLELSESIQIKITNSRKPLIIVGPLAAGDEVKAISDLAKKLNCPVLSESAIDSENTIRGFEGFLRNRATRNQLSPDLILRFGFQPTSKSLEIGLRQWEPAHHYHFASTDSWQDATYSGAVRIPWRGQAINVEEFEASTSKKWFSKWKEVENDFKKFYDQSLRDTKTLTDGAIYHNLTPQITDTHFLTVSNSFPARDIALFGRQASDIPIYINRGASGIDGVTSTALGINLSLEKAGVLFTGDLAFLHDTNALLNHNKIEHPLVIVIANNSGGSIFRMLPIEHHDQYFKRYFETPQTVNIATLADSHGIPYQQISSLSELENLDLHRWTTEHSGLSIIECQTDAGASMQLRKKLWDF